jgi:hypothetical protein
MKFIYLDPTIIRKFCLHYVIQRVTISYISRAPK